MNLSYNDYCWLHYVYGPAVNGNQLQGETLLGQVHVAVKATLPKQRFSGQQAVCYVCVRYVLGVTRTVATREILKK